MSRIAGLNFADKAILNILAKSSEAFLLMLSSIIMVRSFSKTEYGTFLQIMLIADTAIMFTFFGLPQSIFYFFQQASNQKKFILRNVGFSIVLAGIGALIIYALTGQFVGWLNNPYLARYGWVAGLLILFRAPAYFREPFLISHSNLLMNSVTTVLNNIVLFAPLIFAALLSVSLGTLLHVMLFGAFAQFAIYLSAMLWLLSLITTHKDQDISEEPSKTHTPITFIGQLRYAVPIGLSSYMSIIGRQIDQYIVSVFFTPQNFAVYSRGAMRIPVLSTIQFTLHDIMMPEYVKAYQHGDVAGVLRNFHLCIKKVAKINFAVFSLLFAVSPSIMTLLYTQEYVGAASVFRVYLCLLLMSITSYGVILKASGNTSPVMYANFFAILSNILFSILLVSPCGPVGAALATILSEFLRAFYYLWQSCKVLKIGFHDIFPWNFLKRLLWISLLASIPVYCIEFFSYLEGGILFFILLLDGVVYGYCWLFLMMRRGLIDEDELVMLTKWLRFDVARLLRKIVFFS